VCEICVESRESLPHFLTGHLAEYCFWSGEAAPGVRVRRPVAIRVRTACSLQHCSHVIHTSLARKRAGDAEIGWRPAPEKNIETCEKNIETAPCWHLLGQLVAQRIASCTWDVTHEQALSPADLFGGKAPVGALIGLLERIC